MSTQLPLREYQTDALNAVRAAWARGVQRPAVVAPTGAGKTVMFAHLIADRLGGNDDRPQGRALVLVHRDELADQAMDKIRQVSPGLRVGKVKAGDNEVYADVVVASVQTLARQARLGQLLASKDRAGEFMLVIVDEAHHAVAPTWRYVMEQLGCFNGGPDTVGFSATLARGDGVGLGSAWQEVAYAVSLTRLIRRGYLADVRGVQVRVDDLDLNGVRRSGGDYQAGALGTALVDSGAGMVIAKAYREHAADRQGVVFTPTVSAADDALEALEDSGIVSALVTGMTPREERQLIYKRFQAGDVQVLVNCMVLTEGFDAPWASCAVIARPTQSAPLYTQMVGRVLRPWPGKRDALVLDVVGASSTHKLATLIDLEPGRVQAVKPDQSLLEAVDEEEAVEAARHERATPRSLTAAEVDLFETSRSAWLQTRAGMWFVPVAGGEFFLWPASEPGLWDACYAPDPERGQAQKWERLHEGCSLELAMSWAQVEAEEMDSSIASRDASWRKRKVPASEAQLGFLRGLGYRGETEGLSKNDASNLISIGKASRKFDRHYQKAINS